MRHHQLRGFTLVELVVVIIIIGVLAAVAVPRFVDLGRDARIASLQTLAGVLRSTAINVRATCKLNPDCDYATASQTLTIGGRTAWINYGWLDAGDNLGISQIDAWVTYTGFTASLPANSHTTFSLDGAPDPSTCTVSYYDAYFRGPAGGIAVTLDTTGC